MVLVAQLDNLAQQVAEQVVVIQYFLPSHLRAVAVAVRVAVLKLVKQVALVVAVVIVVTLVVLEIPHPHHQAKATMVVHQMPHTMVAVAVVAHLPQVQQPPLRRLAVREALVQHQASVALQ